jgi:hypothetical protein
MSAGRRSNWLAAGVILAVGLVGGRFLHPDRTPTANAPATATTHERVIQVPVAAQTATISRETLRAELRSVLGEMNEQSPAGGNASAFDVAREPTQEQIEAESNGQTLVADAVARGVWNQAAGSQLRKAMDLMTPDQRLATLESLMAAINRGEVKPESTILF